MLGGNGSLNHRSRQGRNGAGRTVRAGGVERRGGGRRAADSAQAAARIIGSATRAVSAADAAAAAEVVLITVPDDMIAEVCGQLAESGSLRKGAVVATLGAGQRALDSVRRSRGGRFDAPAPDVPDGPGGHREIAGVVWASSRAMCAGVAVLESLAKAIGACRCGSLRKPSALPRGGGGSVQLPGDTAGRGGGDGGPSDGRLGRCRAGQGPGGAGPLVKATMESALQLGPDALTGPIARGDADTVRKHLEALDTAGPQLAAMYRQMGRMTAELAARKGSITTQTRGIFCRFCRVEVRARCPCDSWAGPVRACLPMLLFQRVARQLVHPAHDLFEVGFPDRRGDHVVKVLGCALVSGGFDRLAISTTRMPLGAEARDSLIASSSACRRARCASANRGRGRRRSRLARRLRPLTGAPSSKAISRSAAASPACNFATGLQFAQEAFLGLKLRSQLPNGHRSWHL